VGLDPHVWHTADCTVGPACVSLLDGITELLGDKAYDSNAFRKSLRKDRIRPVIPGRSNRKNRIRHDKHAYKGRNVIERCDCRLKDFRRIATRYDKLARNYFSALCLVADAASASGPKLSPLAAPAIGSYSIQRDRLSIFAPEST
jgi:transposase